MVKYYGYNFENVLIELPKDIYKNPEEPLKGEIYINGKNIEIDYRKLDYSKIVLIEVPFRVNDGDIFTLNTVLVICKYNFKKNKFLLKNYITGEVSYSLKQLHQRKQKWLYGNIYREDNFKETSVYDCVARLLNGVYIEIAIKKVLKMPRFHFYTDENWDYFRINLIKWIYKCQVDSGDWSRIHFDLMPEQLKKFLDKTIISNDFTDERKIAVLESLLV